MPRFIDSKPKVTGAEILNAAGFDVQEGLEQVSASADADGATLEWSHKVHLSPEQRLAVFTLIEEAL